MLEEIPYEEADKLVQKLVETAKNATDSIDEKHFLPLPESNGCKRMAAVDGGSAILYNMGSLVVGAIRAGYLVYEKRDLAHEFISPLQMVAVDPVNAPTLYASSCDEMGVPLHEHPQELEAFVHRLRYLKEMRCALDALGHLEEGDTLLLDGSLRSDIPHPGDVLKTVLDQASARGVNVVGVSKSSKLNIDGIPLLSITKNKACQIGLETWAYPVDGEDSHAHGSVSIARFHPSSSFAFRVDVAGDPASIGSLRLHADDPSLLGYPSPLAAIHNRVAIPRATADGIAMVLDTRLATMKDAEDWTGLLTDFHSLLDMGV